VYRLQGQTHLKQYPPQRPLTRFVLDVIVEAGFIEAGDGLSADRARSVTTGGSIMTIAAVSCFPHNRVLDQVVQAARHLEVL
jgi:hypothetical protein